MQFDMSKIFKILYTSCVICLSDIHMRFDVSKILEILYTSCVMCSSDIRVLSPGMIFVIAGFLKIWVVGNYVTL